MPWDQVEGNKTRDYYKKLVALKHLPAFQRGKLRVDSLDGGVYVFRMCHPAGDGLCMLNLSGERKDFAADTLQRMGFAAEQERLLGLEPGKPFSLEPYQGAVFTEAQKPVAGPEAAVRPPIPPELSARAEGNAQEVHGALPPADGGTAKGQGLDGNAARKGENDRCPMQA